MAKYEANKKHKLKAWVLSYKVLIMNQLCIIYRLPELNDEIDTEIRELII